MEIVVTKWWESVAVAVLLATAVACSRVDPAPQLQQAKRFAEAGQAAAAARAYEDLLRANPVCAQAHLELGVLQDEKLGDPVAAIYHYRAYLDLETNAERRQIVEKFIEHSKLSLASKLAGPAAVDAGELARLQTERMTLMQENATLKARLTELETNMAQPATVAGAPPPASAPALVLAAAPIAGSIEVTSGATTATSSPRVHVVQPGDTLQALALRYYGARTEWAKIFEANRTVLENRDRLKIGQRLAIP